MGERQWERIVSEQVGTPRALARSLPDQTVLFGLGWSAMENEIRAALPESVTVTVGPDHAFRPSAFEVAHMGMEQIQCGVIAGSVVAPLYVQRAEAEIQYERSGGISSVTRRRNRVEKKVAARLARRPRRKNIQNG
jgi:tRNA threonylcarbamoyladenosine biosynthesis protein TsaB